MGGPTTSSPSAADPGQGTGGASLAHRLRRAAVRRLRLAAARREVRRGLARETLTPETAGRLRAELDQLGREVRAAGWSA